MYPPTSLVIPNGAISTEYENRPAIQKARALRLQQGGPQGKPSNSAAYSYRLRPAVLSMIGQTERVAA
jgi:hypothetical protein